MPELDHTTVLFNDDVAVENSTHTTGRRGPARLSAGGALRPPANTRVQARPCGQCRWTQAVRQPGKPARNAAGPAPDPLGQGQGA